MVSAVTGGTLNIVDNSRRQAPAARSRGAFADGCGADTKARRALDYPISREMSGRIDLYLERFRTRIPGAYKHTSLWASNQSCPMCGMAIYAAIRKRTKKAFGFAVTLHRFRHAAASFWSSQDPANVSGSKDLLGHASFGTT
jgi:integrase